MAMINIVLVIITIAPAALLLLLLLLFAAAAAAAAAAAVCCFDIGTAERNKCEDGRQQSKCLNSASALDVAKRAAEK